MSLQHDYKSRKVRERKKVDEVLAKRLVEAEREVQPREGNPRGSQSMGRAKQIDGTRSWFTFPALAAHRGVHEFSLLFHAGDSLEPRNP